MSDLPETLDDLTAGLGVSSGTLVKNADVAAGTLEATMPKARGYPS
jgi:hypothetical protein